MGYPVTLCELTILLGTFPSFNCSNSGDIVNTLPIDINIHDFIHVSIRSSLGWFQQKLSGPETPTRILPGNSKNFRVNNHSKAAICPSDLSFSQSTERSCRWSTFLGGSSAYQPEVSATGYESGTPVETENVYQGTSLIYQPKVSGMCKNCDMFVTCVDLLTHQLPRFCLFIFTTSFKFHLGFHVEWFPQLFSASRCGLNHRLGFTRPKKREARPIGPKGDEGSDNSVFYWNPDQFHQIQPTKNGFNHLYL